MNKKQEETFNKKSFITNSIEIIKIKNTIINNLININGKENLKSLLEANQKDNNFVIQQHLKNSPTLASITEKWNEEHWTKVVNIMHKKHFNNCFWDSEVPLKDNNCNYGQIDLILGKDKIEKNKNEIYFKDITVIEVKSKVEARKGLREALYYSHLLSIFFKDTFPEEEIKKSLILLTFPDQKNQLSKPKLKLLEKDRSNILTIYKDLIFDVKIIEMVVASNEIPILEKGEEVVIPNNIIFKFHDFENKVITEKDNLKGLI